LKVLLSFVGEQDPYSDKTGEEGSIVHGMNPVAEDDAFNCLEAIESVMEELIPAAVPLLGEYPLKEKQMEQVIGVLDNTTM